MWKDFYSNSGNFATSILHQQFKECWNKNVNLGIETIPRFKGYSDARFLLYVCVNVNEKANKSDFLFKKKNKAPHLRIPD